jgi:hypothetical protein
MAGTGEEPRSSITEAHVSAAHVLVEVVLDRTCRYVIVLVVSVWETVEILVPHRRAARR